MAFIQNFKCIKCKRIVSEPVQSGRIENCCSKCKSEETKRKKDFFLSGLKSLSLEERISRIEEYLYDKEIPINLYDLRF